MYNACAVCGSDKIIPDISVEDSLSTGWASLEHSVRIAANPKAILSPKVTKSKLKAYICGECGYTALFAAKPQELYQAYQKSLDNE